MKTVKKNLWPVDLITLRLFIAVCEEASISQAAEREAIAPSAISKRITDIEDSIGAPVLVRHRSGVTATPAGEALLQHARMLLRGIEKMQGELSEYAAGVRGHIRIYASVSAIVEFLPADMSAFLAMHDNIKVDMEERVSAQVIRSVEENSAALGVCWDFANTGNLQTIPYKTDRLAAVVHPDHPLAHRDQVLFDETLDYEQIGHQEDSLMNLFLRRIAEQSGKKLVNRIHIATIEGACQMVHAKLGLSILPIEAIHPHRAALGLRAIPLADPWAHRRFVLCMRDYQALPMPTRLFVDFLCPDHSLQACPSSDTAGKL